jgi:hypothetical protein
VSSLADVVRWLEQAPPETLMPAHSVLALLRGAEGQAAPPAAITVAATETWREKLWTVPPETRLGVVEVADALNRPRSFVYRHTSPKSGLPQLPHRRMDGALTFTAGDLRAWLSQHEHAVVEPSIAVVPITRRRTRA